MPTSAIHHYQTIIESLGKSAINAARVLDTPSDEEYGASASAPAEFLVFRSRRHISAGAEEVEKYTRISQDAVEEGSIIPRMNVHDAKATVGFQPAGVVWLFILGPGDMCASIS